MADGHYPAARHDGTPWAEAEEGFGAAGQELGYYGAAVMTEAGWSEYPPIHLDIQVLLNV